jgi:hypothetical protein
VPGPTVRLLKYFDRQSENAALVLALLDHRTGTHQALETDCIQDRNGVPPLYVIGDLKLLEHGPQRFAHRGHVADKTLLVSTAQGLQGDS